LALQQREKLSGNGRTCWCGYGLVLAGDAFRNFYSEVLYFLNLLTVFYSGYLYLRVLIVSQWIFVCWLCCDARMFACYVRSQAQVW
jgi:hypothetical protein